MNLESMSAASESNTEKLLTFVVANETYGIETAHVEEIIGMQTVTATPHSPVDIRGIINLRGPIIPLLDMRRRFGMATLEDDDRRSIVVISYGGATLGLIVDCVSEVLPYSNISIVPMASLNMRLDKSCVDRIGVFKDQIILLVDSSRLTAEPEAPHSVPPQEAV